MTDAILVPFASLTKIVGFCNIVGNVSNGYAFKNYESLWKESSFLSHKNVILSHLKRLMRIFPPDVLTWTNCSLGSLEQDFVRINDGDFSNSGLSESNWCANEEPPKLHKSVPVSLMTLYNHCHMFNRWLLSDRTKFLCRHRVWLLNILKSLLCTGLY